MGDICQRCDGTGERDFLSGARCLECDGTGWIDEPEEPWESMSLQELTEYEQNMDELTQQGARSPGKIGAFEGRADVAESARKP